MFEEEAPPQRRKLVDPPVLDSFGIAELEAYIAELSAEIARVEAAIARKHSYRGTAEAVFGKR